MPSARSQAFMRYTLISANILVIVLVSLAMIRGLLNIKDKSFLDQLSVKNISSVDATNLTTSAKHKSIALIIDSLLRYANALLGLWAGVKLSFTLLIVYGIVLIISLVLSITVGLGSEQYGTVFDVETYSIGAFHISIGILLALLAFRLACLTKTGVDGIETDSEVREDEQNQCEIV